MDLEESEQKYRYEIITVEEGNIEQELEAQALSNQCSTGKKTIYPNINQSQENASI